MEPYVYDLQFISIRVICPKSPRTIILDAQRTVDFIAGEPDWTHLDDVVCTFLETHHIEECKRLPNPQPHPAGGWVTHTFDMGCPRQIWIFPDSARKGGS